MKSIVGRFLIAFVVALCVYPSAFSQETVKIYGVVVPVAPASIDDNQSKIKPAVSASYAPLNNKKKIEFGLKNAFLNPGAYVFPAVVATFQQIEADEPNKDTEDEIADGFSRYAINFGTSSSKALFAGGVYPILFDQDPRYEPSAGSGFKARLLYAVSRVFVTRGDNGNIQANASLLAGDLTAAGLANIWEQNTPGKERKGAKATFRRFGYMVLFDIARTVVLKEFGPELKKLLP